MTRFQHILVPVDFEEPSREALEVAVDFALRFEAKLTIVHAWEIPPYVYVGVAYLPADLWTAVEQAATEELATTLAEVRKRLPRAESILAKGSAALAVLAAAEQSGADLIVMGTHGRRGVSRAFLGSIAERVVRSSPVPVLTIHGKGRKTAVAEASDRHAS